MTDQIQETNEISQEEAQIDKSGLSAQAHQMNEQFNIFSKIDHLLHRRKTNLQETDNQAVKTAEQLGDAYHKGVAEPVPPAVMSPNVDNGQPVNPNSPAPTPPTEIK